MFTNFIRQTKHKLPIVFQEHPATVNKHLHAFRVAQTTECAAKQDSIKSCYSAHDAVFVPCQKALHDSPPLMLCKDIMCEEIMGRHYLPRFIFGCGPNGLLQANSWIVCVEKYRSTKLPEHHEMLRNRMPPINGYLPPPAFVPPFPAPAFVPPFPAPAFVPPFPAPAFFPTFPA